MNELRTPTAATRADPFDLAETLADLPVAIELSDLSIVTRNPRIHFDQFFPQLSYKREARIRVSNPGVGDWTGQNLMRRPPVGLIVWTCW
ncbi:MAG: hypothetical protein WA231_16475 [Methylocella sp.]